MSGEPGTQAGSKTTAPGIFLVVVGFLNLVGGLILIGIGIFAMAALPAMVNQATNQMKPEERARFLEQKAELEKGGKSFDQQMQLGGAFYLGWGVVSLIGSILTIIGGFKMMSLRSYGLALTGCIVAAVPGVSPSMCCILGLVAGIWGLVVLMNADVKAAFGRSSE